MVSIVLSGVPSQAKVGSTITMFADISTGWSALGETFVAIWEGNAPNMPREQTLTFSAGIGETKRIQFSFIMPDKVITFRLKVRETSGWFDGGIWFWTGFYVLTTVVEITGDQSIIPSDKTLDPTAQSFDIGDWIEKFGAWIASNVLTVVLAVAALIVITVVARKKLVTVPKKP